MSLTRRQAIAGGGGGLACLIAPGAFVQAALAQAAYPNRTIKMIVPYPAGGTTDFLGRLVADQLKAGLGATVIVENKPGAGTTLGAEQVAKSEPDGYTLLMATSTTLAINKTLYKKLPYDPVTDFAPIALVAAVPFALIANPQIPVKTLSDFIAYAKSKPGLAYGSAGNGSPQHLGAEMLKAATGIDIRHVPYRGNGEAYKIVRNQWYDRLVSSAVSRSEKPLSRLRVLAPPTARASSAAPSVSNCSARAPPPSSSAAAWCDRVREHESRPGLHHQFATGRHPRSAEERTAVRRSHCTCDRLSIPVRSATSTPSV